MPIINIMCPICTDAFKNSDEVHCTICGHLFHLSCLSSWQMRHRNCPQCRFENPTTYKLNLTFDESEQMSEIDEDLEIKLVSAKQKVAQLQEQKKDEKRQLLQIQKQFTAVDNSNAELEEEMSALIDMENEFMQLQAQYTKSSEYGKELEDQINQLFIRNECKSQELKIKTLENDTIKTKNISQQSHSTDGILNDKIYFLEQKIKRISDEFRNEIKLSAELSVENKELQRCLDNLQNPLDKIKNEPITKHFKPTTIANSEKANYVIIKQFPLEQSTMPLENVIILLASKMNFHISTDDLIQVKCIPSNNKISRKVQLFVEFKSTVMKNRFLLNNTAFKKDPTFKNICIEDLHELYLYAQSILQNYGYYVFYKQYKIFAKKKATSNAENLHIQSKPQVDRIKINLDRIK